MTAPNQNAASNVDLISVIVPIHTSDHLRPAVTEAVKSSPARTELIVVINGPGSGPMPQSLEAADKLVTSERQGRGYAFTDGIKEANGEIVVLLHSDTILPVNWAEAIRTALEDPRVVGGAFSRSFDEESGYLWFLTHLGDLFTWLIGDIWGDRAMFVRAEVLRRCLPELEIPIMEDVRLSKCMRGSGKVKLLKESVITSADHFREYGKIGHTLRFLRCRVWYAFGGSPDDIFRYYYP